MTVSNACVNNVGIPCLRLRLRPNTQDVDKVVHVSFGVWSNCFRLLKSVPKTNICPYICPKGLATQSESGVIAFCNKKEATCNRKTKRVGRSKSIVVSGDNNIMSAKGADVKLNNYDIRCRN